VGALQGQGEISLRELAHRVERDVKRMHEDVQELLELGLVECGEGGGWCAPSLLCSSTWSVVGPLRGRKRSCLGLDPPDLVDRDVEFERPVSRRGPRVARTMPTGHLRSFAKARYEDRRAVACGATRRSQSSSGGRRTRRNPVPAWPQASTCRAAGP
jgi:hypothetical protein